MSLEQTQYYFWLQIQSFEIWNSKFWHVWDHDHDSPRLHKKFLRILYLIRTLKKLFTYLSLWLSINFWSKWLNTKFRKLIPLKISFIKYESQSQKYFILSLNTIKSNVNTNSGTCETKYKHPLVMINLRIFALMLLSLVQMFLIVEQPYLMLIIFIRTWKLTLFLN